MRSSYRHLLLFLAVLATASILLSRDPGLIRAAQELIISRPSWQAPVWAWPKLFRPEPRIEKWYQACGHREAVPLPEGIDLRLAGQKELEVLFPENDGWTMRYEDNGRLIITKKVPGLCPEDAAKRHLGELNGRLAVYRGPAGYEEELESVLEVRTEDLPDNWRERIRTGQAEFSSREELFKALDSLEEYSANAR